MFGSDLSGAIPSVVEFGIRGEFRLFLGCIQFRSNGHMEPMEGDCSWGGLTATLRISFDGRLMT